jgi:capsular polysaccharide biosynthesis protein
MVEDYLEDLILIYPEGWKKNRYVNETLSLFPKLKIEIIPNDYHIFVKNLVMPEVKPWTPMVIPEHVFSVRNFFKEKKQFTINQDLNIYISREDAKYKKIQNETEFVHVINQFNFEKVTMSDKSIFEQIELMQNTKNLIAITGASMANLIFLKEGSTLIDLTNEMYLYDRKYKFHFKKIVDLLNGNYIVQFSKPVVDRNLPDIAMYDIQVNLDDLVKNIQSYIS